MRTAVELIKPVPWFTFDCRVILIPYDSFSWLNVILLQMWLRHDVKTQCIWKFPALSVDHSSGDRQWIEDHMISLSQSATQPTQTLALHIINEQSRTSSIFEGQFWLAGPRLLQTHFRSHSKRRKVNTVLRVLQICFGLLLFLHNDLFLFTKNQLLSC